MSKELLNEIEYVSRITANYDILSKSEKKIADYIINNKEDVIKFPINVFAERAGTSMATVTRFTKTLGFKGYNELKFYIERQLLSPSGDHNKIDRNDSIGIIKQKLLNYHKEIIDDTLMVLQDTELDKAISTIPKANNIHLYGEGGSGGSILVASELFIQIGINCSAYTDAFSQVAAANILNKTDVAIGISHSGRSVNTIDALKIARQKKAVTICITGHVNSPITEHADIVLYTSSQEQSTISDSPSARISEICVLSILQAGIITVNYEKHLSKMQNFKEVIEVKRVKKP